MPGSDKPARPDSVEVTIEGSEPVAVPSFPETKASSGRAITVSGEAVSRSSTRRRDAEAVAQKVRSTTEATPPDSKEPTATGTIEVQGSLGAPSGLATFQPAHPDLRGGLKLPPEENAKRDVLAPPVARPSTSPARELPKVLHGGAGVSASIAEDGSIRLHGPDDVSANGPGPQAVGSGAGLGVTGRFDITDQVMKWAGQDPYAAIKSKLADETREQRLCMARRYQGERQKQELVNLSSKIRRIAARLDLSAIERRRLVFEIWDECLEESDAGSHYGVMARATILSLVREVFPEGSQLAYHPTELLALNESRSSRQPFTPYQRSAVKRSRPDVRVPSRVPSEEPCGLP
jgi:hypothetical protein